MWMRLSTRKAFTLIELLVVIAVIGVLMAILLPAIQKVREASNRAKCTNNLRQIGLALHNYDSANGVLPFGDRITQTSSIQHGPGVQILPFLEQGPLHEQYKYDVAWFQPANSAVVQTHLKVFQCPSTPTQNRIFAGTEGSVSFTAAATDYIAPSGIAGGVKTYVQTNHGMTINDDKGALTKKSVGGAKAVNGIKEIADGTSHTVIYIEAAGKPDLWTIGRQPYAGSNTKTGWASHSSGFDPALWVAGCGSGVGSCAINCCNDQGIYSFHPSGANVAYADGSVRFFREGLSPVIFVSILTRANGEVISGSEY